MRAALRLAIRAVRRLVALSAPLVIAACQPLPHPFEDDRPPSSLIDPHDAVAIAVTPIDGTPEKTSTKLSGAITKALRDREIPATDGNVSPGSYLLFGRIDSRPTGKGKSQISTTWRLRDGSGNVVGQGGDRVEAADRDWQDGKDEAVAKLANKTAAALAALLQEQPPTEVAGGGRIRVAVGKIKGAPGDGGRSLASAVTAVMRRQDVPIVDDGKKADLYIDADVAISPVKPDKQHVKIVWRVRRADGGEIGTVAQENDVPRGLLDGAWGDVAYSVALAAGNGIEELVARGTPPSGRPS